MWSLKWYAGGTPWVVSMFLGPKRLLQFGARVAACNPNKAALSFFVLLRFNASPAGRCVHATHTRVVDTLARPRPPWHLHVLFPSPPRRALFCAIRGVLLPFCSFVRLVSYPRKWSVVVTCVVCLPRLWAFPLLRVRWARRGT